MQLSYSRHYINLINCLQETQLTSQISYCLNIECIILDIIHYLLRKQQISAVSALISDFFCRYFSCRPKYGLFSPLQCISKAGSSSSRRTSTPSSRLSTTPLRRSNSRESLGGQSATSSIGASSVASSIKPTYRVSVVVMLLLFLNISVHFQNN